MRIKICRQAMALVGMSQKTLQSADHTTTIYELALCILTMF